MLTETFIAASSAPPKAASAQSALLKDAGIFLHTFQPHPALRSTFKKSAAHTNCLAISKSHILSAQVEKAVVHVYSREKGNQEATVPFPERIHSLALAANETVLLLGTESGRITVWETSTGRSLSTSASHLQPVTVLVVDDADNFILSASADATVLVWSLLDLLSFSTTSARTAGQIRQPRHALTGHNAAITAVTCGHSRATSNIAISTSKDNTAIVWDYIAGTLLRTILLPSSPLCVTLDPADRAAYTGYIDGSVQRLDFYSPFLSASTIRDHAQADTALQPPPSSRWPYSSTDTASDPSANINAALSLTLSYDGTTLLSGHANGAINTWDAATGRFAGTLAQHTGAPITNLQMQTPTGFPHEPQPSFHQSAVVKPRPYEQFAVKGSGTPSEAYTMTLSFPSRLSDTSSHLRAQRRSRRIQYTPDSTFDALLTGPGIPPSTLEESIRTLTDWRTSPTAANTWRLLHKKYEPQPNGAPNGAPNENSNEAKDEDADFLPLEDEDEETPEQSNELVTLQHQIAFLRRSALGRDKLVQTLVEEIEGAEEAMDALRKKQRLETGRKSNPGPKVGRAAARLWEEFDLEVGRERAARQAKMGDVDGGVEEMDDIEDEGHEEDDDIDEEEHEEDEDSDEEVEEEEEEEENDNDTMSVSATTGSEAPEHADMRNR